jgi:hypothetical protein
MNRSSKNWVVSLFKQKKRQLYKRDAPQLFSNQQNVRNSYSMQRFCSTNFYRTQGRQSTTYAPTPLWLFIFLKSSTAIG